MGIFSKLAGPVGGALLGAAEEVGSAGLNFVKAPILGSRNTVHIPAQMSGESDSVYLRRVQEALRMERAQREPVGDAQHFLNALGSTATGTLGRGRERELIDKFLGLSSEQQLLISRTGGLDALRSQSFREDPSMLKPLVPEKARNILKGIPVVGEEAERMTTGMTSPLGITGAGALPGIAGGKAVLFGALGATGGGVAGQQLEAAGVDPRLRLGPVTIGPAVAGGLLGRRIPGVGGLRGAVGAGAAGMAAEQATGTPALELGPRSVGELAGGLWTGGAKLDTPQGRLRRVSDVRIELEKIEEAMALQRLSDDITSPHYAPSLSADMVQLRAQIDDAPLAQHNYTARMQAGDTEPLGMMERLFADAVGEPGGASGAFGAAGEASSGILSGWERLPGPLRWVVNRGTRKWLYKQGSPDFTANVMHSFVEDMETSVQGGLQVLMRASDEAGLGIRLIPDATGFGDTAANLLTKTSGRTARRVVAPLTDEPIAGMKAGKGGLDPTAKNFFEHPEAFDLTSAHVAANDTYQAFITGANEHVRKALADLGWSTKQIDDFLPKIKGRYFHRLVVDEEGNISNLGTRAWGGKQTVQLERAAEDQVTTRYVDSLVASAQDYANEMTHILAYEGMLKPMANSLGVKIDQFIPVGFLADLDVLNVQSKWLVRARKVVNDAAAGRKPQSIARRVSELAQEEGIPPELKDLLYPLANVDDDIISAAGVNVVQATRKASRETERLARRSTDLVRQEQNRIKAMAAHFRKEQGKAITQGDIAARQTAANLDRIQTATENIITEMAASRAALGGKAMKGAGAAARVSEGGTLRVAVRELEALMAEVDRVTLPQAVQDAVSRIERAAAGIDEAVARANFATAGGETVAKAAPKTSGPAARAGKALTSAVKAGDEAVGVAETLQRGRVASGEYRTTAREAGKVLKGAVNQNRASLASTKKQMRLARAIISKSQGYRAIDMRKFPGLSQYRFQETLAKQVENAFQAYEHTEGFWQNLNQVMALEQSLQASTADIGQFGLHLLPMLRPGTVKLLPKLIKDSLSAENTQKYLLGAQQRFSMDGTSMWDHAVRGNLRQVVEAANPLSIVNRPGGTMTAGLKFIQDWPVNEFFSNGVRYGRMSQFEHNILLLEAMTGAPITDDLVRTAARNAEMITGDFNWTRAGISQSQRVAERTGLRFAPTWIRSQVKLIGSAATLGRGAEAQLARKALAAELATLTTLYVGSAAATGLGPLEVGKRLLPLNTDGSYNRDFMTVDIKGVKMGPGGPILSLMRTAGKMADLSYKAANGDKDALARLTDIRDSGQPLVSFWRAGAPTMTGLLYDIVQGRESYGNRRLGTDVTNPEEMKNNALSFMEGWMPFTAQSLVDEGPLSAAIQGVGGRSFPVSAPEKFLNAADKAAEREGFASWADTPKATRNALIRDNPELNELEAEREKFFERFQNDDDKIYEEIDKSQGTMEDVLLASYAAVQAGALSIPDFRQRFSDLQRQHGYLANSLLEAKEGGLERAKGETVEDWYARQYTAIQPEQFDRDQDGVVDEMEWQAWREARSSFWKDNPEAGAHRSYITIDYAAKKWKTPEMAAIALERYQALDLYEEFLAMPKYKGISTKDGAFIDRARQAKRRMQTEAQYGGQQMSSKQAWRAVLQQSPNLSNREVQLLQIAISLDKDKARQRLLNPARVEFLQQNQLLPEWYPSVLTDAGVGVGERQQAGFGPPTGTPALELVEQMRSAA